MYKLFLDKLLAYFFFNEALFDWVSLNQNQSNYAANEIDWRYYVGTISIVFSRPVFGPPEEERGLILQTAAGSRVKCLKE